MRYDGTSFSGSQEQAGRMVNGTWRAAPRTVSGTLTNKLEGLLQEPVHLLWASRTDRGVHAEANVCAFDADLPMPLTRLITALDSRLPHDLRVSGGAVVEPDWHPRHSATAREYVYRIWLGRDAPYDRMRFTYVHRGRWDNFAAVSAAQLFLGRHDFRTLSRTNPAKDRNAFCTVEAMDIQHFESEMRLTMRANRFLWRMACMVAGTILAAAEWRLDETDIKAILAGGSSGKVMALPAHGLVLMKVLYDEKAGKR